MLHGTTHSITEAQKTLSAAQKEWSKNHAKIQPVKQNPEGKTRAKFLKTFKILHLLLQRHEMSVKVKESSHPN